MMRVSDIFRFVRNAAGGYRVRTALMLLAMAIGVASVVILTSLGEGARVYVNNEFASLGTNLLIVLPGRNETSGGPPMMVTGTSRDITTGDAMALLRHSSVRRVAPLTVGVAPVSWGGRTRECTIGGSTPDMLAIRHWKMAQGGFPAPDDPERAAPVAVIGAKIRRELFGSHSAVGEWLKIGDRRFRVTGILASEGRSMGFDVEELVLVPVASAQALFNTPSLFRVMVEAKSREAIERARADVVSTFKLRHQGEEDVTVITQDAVLATFDKILRALTYTVGGIAAISLGVAGILIMNVMLVAVSQRTSEIGLLKALGASRRRILALFLTEAAMLSCVGGLLGLIMGYAGNRVVIWLYPAFPVTAPWWAVAAALGIALSAGLIFGAMPAWRAAKLDPVMALARR